MAKGLYLAIVFEIMNEVKEGKRSRSIPVPKKAQRKEKSNPELFSH